MPGRSQVFSYQWQSSTNSAPSHNARIAGERDFGNLSGGVESDSGKALTTSPRDVTSFNTAEVAELTRLYSHLNKAISSGGLPPPKLKLARDTLGSIMARVKPIHILAVAPPPSHAASTSAAGGEAEQNLELYKICVGLFHSIRELYLNQCPPTTVLELYSLRFQLSHLEIINSGIFSVSQLLGPEKWDRSVAAACLPMQLPIVSSTISSQQAQLGIPDAMQWRQLTVLRMSNCAIDRLDRGMHLLPRLEQLDLSYNDIAHVVHLQDCRNLRVLNVSHNRIRVLSNLNRVIRGIRKLNLAFNCIESLDGLGSLDLLEWLDVSYNRIDDFGEVSHLSGLPRLETLCMEGNVIAAKQHYRLHVFSRFLHSAVLTGKELPLLDSRPISEEEAYALRGVLFKPSRGQQSSHQFAMAPNVEEFIVHVSGNGFSDAESHFFSSNTISDLSVVELDQRFKETMDSWSRSEEKSAAISNSNDDVAVKSSFEVIARDSAPASPIGAGSAGDDSRLKVNGTGSPGAMTSPGLKGFTRTRRYIIKESYTRSSSEESHVSLLAPGRSSIATSKDAVYNYNSIDRTDSNSASVSSPSPLTRLSPGLRDSRGSTALGSLSPRAGKGLNMISTMALNGLESLSTDKSTRRAPKAVVSDDLSSKMAVLLTSLRSDVDSNSFSLISSHDLTNSEYSVPVIATTVNASCWDADKEERERRKEELLRKLIASKSRIEIAPPTPIVESDKLVMDDTEAILVDDTVADAPQPEARTRSLGIDISDARQQAIRDAVGPLASFSGFSASPTQTGDQSAHLDTNNALVDMIANEDSSLHLGSTDAQRNISNSGVKIAGGADGGDYDLFVDSDRLLSLSTGSVASSVVSQQPNSFVRRMLSSTGEKLGSGFAEAASLGAGTKRNALPIRTEFPAAPVNSTARLSMPYVGNSDYASFNVIENYELYFREQVFHDRRPSYPSLFMQLETSGGQGAQASSGLTCYMPPSTYPERLVAVHREKVISLRDNVVVDDFGFVGSQGSAAFSSLHGQHGHGKARDDVAVKETFALLVVTDIHLYIVRDMPRTHSVGSGFPGSPVLFSDAPLPVLIRSYLLEDMMSCTIFFGFQRCALQFQKSTGTSGDTYIIVSRDKSRMYPIVSTLPRLANSARVGKTTIKVPIENNDAQLLEQLGEILKELKCAHLDVLHYQMLYQFRGTDHPSPDKLVPRTLIVSQEMLLLCNEDLSSSQVRLTLVDSTPLKSITKIHSEDNPLHLTVFFRSNATMFGRPRKWRLSFDSRSVAAKTRDECRRACAEVGNTTA